MSEENQKKDTITIKKNALWKYSTLLLVAVVVVGAIVMFSGNKGGTGQAIGNLPSGGTADGNADVEIGNDAVLGDANAPVTIIEFTDFQCPFCGRHYTQTFPQIKTKYIDTGKVRYVIKDFPLVSIHPMALPAAEAAECVKEAGGDEAYFKYKDKLFTNQESLSTANLKTWAKELGYDVGKCLDSEKFKNEVMGDVQEGTVAGVQGTPAFFVNGQFVNGAQPYSVFEGVIESYL